MATQTLALNHSTRNISNSCLDHNSSKRPSGSQTITINPPDNIQLQNMAGRVENTPNLQEDPARSKTITKKEEHVYEDIIISRKTNDTDTSQRERMLLTLRNQDHTMAVDFVVLQ